MTPPRTILATDCGSTTTKAILIVRRGGVYRLAGRGEAASTVEAPFDDVTIGVRNSIAELQELCAHPLLRPDGAILTPANDAAGVDLYVSTSSAGGGLQMLVLGAVRRLTAESGERAALSAGAIVMDVIALNDGCTIERRIETLRSRRPDMLLLTGGTDGGSIRHVAELAELVRAAQPRPRIGNGSRLPVVFAGNRDAAAIVRERLSSIMALDVVANVRPALDHERLDPARERIHDLFMEHVMAQAPGYDKLLRMVAAPILPTPHAVGRMIQTAAAARGQNVVAVDIGGATTDVFSVVGGRYHRTVSANLGMSYSISTVLAATGMPNVMRWLPAGGDERALRDRIRNKMVRPTTIPETVDDLRLEHAIAREALRLSFEQHEHLAGHAVVPTRERGIADVMGHAGTQSSLNRMDIDLIIGSGGVLSHAPRRAQAMMMLIDSFQPQGVTQLAIDSIFMLPHLGVLSTVCPQAALEVFEHDCLVPLGTAIAPVGRVRPGRRLCTIHATGGSGPHELHLCAGEFRRAPLPPGETRSAWIRPVRGVDVGAGPGRALKSELRGGVVGLVLDGRGRPLILPATPSECAKSIADWEAEIDAYP